MECDGEDTGDKDPGEEAPEHGDHRTGGSGRASGAGELENAGAAKREELGIRFGDLMEALVIRESARGKDRQPRIHSQR